MGLVSEMVWGRQVSRQESVAGPSVLPYQPSAMDVTRLRSGQG